VTSLSELLGLALGRLGDALAGCDGEEGRVGGLGEDGLGRALGLRLAGGLGAGGLVEGA
jgi:hypothetical protein